MNYEQTTPNNIFTAANITRDYEKIRHPKWDVGKKFSKAACLEAEIQYSNMVENSETGWRSKIKVYKQDNFLFSNCRTMNGIPKDQFLKRFLAFHPVINSDKISCTKLLTSNCEKIHPLEVLQNNILDSMKTIDEICCIFTTFEWQIKSMEWLSNNSQLFWNNFAGCLLLENHPIRPDICIAIAFLIYKLQDKLSIDIIPIFINLVTITTECCEHYDEYLKTESQTKFKIGRNEKKISQHVPFEVKNMDFLLLSTVIYCQTFVISYYFNEHIFMEFIQNLQRMTDMGRHIYLDLLSLMVKMLIDLLNTHGDKSKWLSLTEDVLEKLTNFPELNPTNKQNIYKINQTLRNGIVAIIPNYIVKCRRMGSGFENKMILSKRKTSDREFDFYNKTSTASNLFPFTDGALSYN